MIISFLIATIMTIVLTRKGMFLIGFIKRGMITPSKSDVRKFNFFIKKSNKKRFSLSPFILKEILFFQVKIFLIKTSKGDKFINSVNQLINTLYQYPFKRSFIEKRLARILQKYDVILMDKLGHYVSPKPNPVLDLLRKVSELKKANENYFNLTLKAGQEALIPLIGNPFINSELRIYRVNESVIDEMKNILGKSGADFMKNVVVAAA